MAQAERTVVVRTDDEGYCVPRLCPLYFACPDKFQTNRVDMTNNWRYVPDPKGDCPLKDKEVEP